MLSKLYRLMCDHCGSTTPPYPTTQEARSGAKKAWRWTRRPKQGDTPARDLCPRCSK